MSQRSPANAARPIGGARLAIDSLRWRPFGRAEPILENFSLHIAPGEHVLLAGPSGSGKSTLLRAIAGVLASTEAGELGGTITIDGQRAGSAGLLLQDPTDAQVAGLVGRDVAFGPENSGVDRAALWTAVRATLAAVHFPYGIDHPVSATSGGQAQRLALAGVLVLGTRLILLDEPTSMLDPVSAAAVRAAVWAAGVASGATIVLVEHRFEAWLPMLDRMVVLNTAGRVVADGPIRETLQCEERMLAAQGIWVPGHAAPPLATVAAAVLQPAAGAAVPGTVLLRVTGVSVIRPPRSGLLSSGTFALPVEPALTAVDAVVRAGEILAITGPSGAGKSTLTALIAGLTLPTCGTITLSDSVSDSGDLADKGLGGSYPVSSASGRQPGRLSSRALAHYFGWVPQRAELAIIARTVREDVVSTALRLGRNPTVAAARTDDLLIALGLAKSHNVDPHALSGGEQRRLALAGALAHSPAVLVLDEPTVGQDRATWAAVVGLLVSARTAGVAVVVATHDPLLIALADRRLELVGGRVLGGENAHTETGTESDTADGGDRQPNQADKPLFSEPRPEVSATRHGSENRGFAARCGPLSLLAVGFLLLGGSIAITTLSAAIPVLIELLLLPLVIGRNGFAVRRLLPGLVAVASIGFSTWLLGEAHDPLLGVVAGLRVAFFVIPGVLLAGFIDPSALGDHLAQRLRFPARPVIAAVAALQRFDDLGRHWVELRGIRRVRGLGSGRSPLERSREFAGLTFALLVQTIRQAARMAVAMDARGFSSPRPPGVPRSWAASAPWTRADTLLTLGGFVLALLPLLAQIL